MKESGSNKTEMKDLWKNLLKLVVKDTIFTEEEILVLKDTIKRSEHFNHMNFAWDTLRRNLGEKSIPIFESLLEYPSQHVQDKANLNLYKLGKRDFYGTYFPLLTSRDMKTFHGTLRDLNYFAHSKSDEETQRNGNLLLEVIRHYQKTNVTNAIQRVEEISEIIFTFQDSEFVKSAVELIQTLDNTFSLKLSSWLIPWCYAYPDKIVKEDLLPLLEHQNPAVRWNAIRIFNDHGMKEDVHHIERLLKDPSQSIRKRATECKNVLCNPGERNNNNYFSYEFIQGYLRIYNDWHNRIQSIDIDLPEDLEISEKHGYCFQIHEVVRYEDDLFSHIDYPWYNESDIVSDRKTTIATFLQEKATRYKMKKYKSDGLFKLKKDDDGLLPYMKLVPEGEIEKIKEVQGWLFFVQYKGHFFRPTNFTENAVQIASELDHLRYLFHLKVMDARDNINARWVLRNEVIPITEIEEDSAYLKKSHFDVCFIVENYDDLCLVKINVIPSPDEFDNYRHPSHFNSWDEREDGWHYKWVLRDHLHFYKEHDEQYLY